MSLPYRLPEKELRYALRGELVSLQEKELPEGKFRGTFSRLVYDEDRIEYGLFVLDTPFPWHGRDARYLFVTPFWKGGRIGVGLNRIECHVGIATSDAIATSSTFRVADVDVLGRGEAATNGLVTTFSQTTPAPPSRAALAEVFAAARVTTTTQAQHGDIVRITGVVTPLGGKVSVPTTEAPAAMWALATTAPGEPRLVSWSGTNMTLDDGGPKTFVRFVGTQIVSGTSTKIPAQDARPLARQLFRAMGVEWRDDAELETWVVPPAARVTVVGRWDHRDPKYPPLIAPLDPSGSVWIALE